MVLPPEANSKLPDLNKGPHCRTIGSCFTKITKATTDDATRKGRGLFFLANFNQQAMEVRGESTDEVRLLSHE
jgi:hypothetical protein